MRRVLLLPLIMGCSSVSPPIEAGSHEPDANTIVAVDSPARDVNWIPDASIDLGTISEDAGDITYTSLDSDLPRAYVSNQLSVSSNVRIQAGTDYYMGDSILSGDVIIFIDGQIANNLLPFDPDAIYVFLTGYNITVDSGDLCNVYCGWHNNYQLPVGVVQYALVGNPETHACTQYSSNPCSAFAANTNTPNGDWAADSMVSVLMHELAETASDPNPGTGWGPNNSGTEIGDMCSWDFGDTYNKDGYIFNIGVGGKLYLAQKLWKRVDNRQNHCALSFNGNPGFIPTGTPTILNDGQDIIGQVYYFGGQVMSKPIHVNLIWYGEWHNYDSTKAVLNDLINNLGGSHWWDIVSNGYFELLQDDAGISDANIIDAGSP